MLFQRNPKEFQCSCVSVDQLVHNRDQESVETVDFTRRPCSEKGKVYLISRKGDHDRFLRFTRCDLHGFYPMKGKTVIGPCYAELLSQFDVGLQKKRSHFAKKKVLFHNDNTPANIHQSQVGLHYKLLPHPPYSPDLTPCDCFLFLNFKVIHRSEN